MLKNKYLFFLFLVALPTAITGVYHYKYSSDQYISTSKFIIQGSNQQSSDALGMFSGFTGTPTNSKDSMAVRDYILSSDLIKSLQTKLDIRKHYSHEGIDFWSRVPEGAGKETLLEYWNNYTNISFDTTSGISTLEVTAFTPKAAVDINKLILAQSEIFTNNISKKAREDAVELAATEQQIAKQELQLIREKIYSFNRNEQIVNPQQRASAEEAIISELNQKLSTAETELTRLSSFMQNSSLKVRAAKAEISSLKLQIIRQQEKWQQTNPDTGKSVTTLIQDTSQFTTELAFAEKIYESAIVGLRQAKMETKQQQRYLEIIVTPQLPEESLKPERVTDTLSVFFASFMIWGILSLLIASIKDHLGWV